MNSTRQVSVVRTTGENMKKRLALAELVPGQAKRLFLVDMSEATLTDDYALVMDAVQDWYFEERYDKMAEMPELRPLFNTLFPF